MAVSESVRHKVISLESAQGFMGSNPEGTKEQQMDPDSNYKGIAYPTRKGQ